MSGNLISKNSFLALGSPNLAQQSESCLFSTLPYIPETLPDFCNLLGNSQIIALCTNLSALTRLLYVSICPIDQY
jgi:hypothetical protein